MAMIFHVYSEYNPTNPDTVRRMRVAKASWNFQPWIELPVHESKCRVFRDRGGTVPYVKDILKIACADKAPGDIVIFTNSDTCVALKCSSILVAALQAANALYCFRRDFHLLNTPLPDPIIPTGAHYGGSDLHAFRIGWWNHYEPSFPDMLLGREAWDSLMRIMMEDTHHGNRVSIPNLIYHERHASTWESLRNRRSLPSQLHNLNLARTWMLRNNHNPREIGI